MRAGCSGCLATLVGVALGTLLIGGVLTITVRILALPEGGAPVTSAADGTRAQQKLVALARQGRRPETVTLSEAEVNALLARHVVEVRGARLAGLSARLVGGDRMELRARTPLGLALDEVGVGALAGALPASWRARPVHLRVGARLTVDEAAGPRQLRLDVDDFAVGRQRLPAPILRLLVDPATVALLRWRLPEHVERVGIEPGRVVIRTAS
jgi:hypothetical protein